jgi:glycosyltransferase involved in cell wall biosynthesis
MTRAPRVLLSALALAQPMGGVRRQAAELFPRVARLLHREGGSLTVLASRDGLPEELENNLPATTNRVQSDAASGGPLARALTEPRALKSALEGAESRGEPFDLVHTGHMPVPGIATPFSLMLHDLRDLEKGGAPLWRRTAARHLLPKTLARAAAICTVSNTMVGEISHHYPSVAEKIKLIPHGCDHLAVRPRAPGPLYMDCVLNNAESQAGRIGLDEGTTVDDERPPLLYLGHLEPRKNLDLLLDTIVRDPSLPRLLMVGLAKNGEDLRLAARTRELGITGRVSFLGPAPESELPAILAGAACMVMPSRIEGFGLPVLEAHRAGLPIAIARAGALPEAAAPGTPSFSPDSPEECARAIHAALGLQPSQLAEAERFAGRFTWERSARSLFEAWVVGAGLVEG